MGTKIIDLLPWVDSALRDVGISITDPELYGKVAITYLDTNTARVVAIEHCAHRYVCYEVTREVRTVCAVRIVFTR